MKIVVVEPDASKVNLGMDLVGGTRVLLKPETNVSEDLIDQTIATLETRINTYGLRESKFQKVEDIEGNIYAQIEMAGGSIAEIEELLSKQGKFEGKIPLLVSFEDKSSFDLEIGDNTYVMSNPGGDKFVVNGETIMCDGSESTAIEDIPFDCINKTNNSAVITATVFVGNDIKSVCMQEQPGICVSRVTSQKGGYGFMFQIFITQESAEKFAKMTKNLETIVDPNTGSAYLESRIALLLDDNLITELSIASELAGQALTEPTITGGRPTKEEAIKQKLMLQSILQSGELPVKLEVSRVDQISANLGADFIKSALMAGGIAAVAVAIIVFGRYRKIKIVVPMLLTSLSEVIIIFGAATLINWTIDLAAIAGIIAVLGTGVDAQIMIVDELRLGKEKIFTLKQKIKRAFFIIFGAASTTIAAMLPLMFIGIGVMRGFAITTTLGVLIAVFITRPAFSEIIQKVIE